MSKMDLSCKCQAVSLESEELLVRIDDKQKSVERISLDFGKVAVFGHYARRISIENIEETQILSYRIKRDAEVDEIYQVFKFDKMEGFLHVRKQVKLKITYTPKIPFQVDVDHFEFVDSCFNIINLTVRGESIGPQLSTSAKFLTFTLNYPKNVCKNVLEIKNITGIPTDFKFDVDEDEELFRVEPKQGTITGKSFYLNISFSPRELGVYSQQLACLVLGHDPLIIDLFGLYTKERDDATFRPYLFPFEETIGYGAYLKDTGNVKKTVPPVSLTKSNIDFGRLLLENNRSNIANQPISLTNHLDDFIEVTWIEGNQVFQVFPKRVRIPPKDSSLFEFCFVPTENYGIYNKTLIAQICWSSEKIKTIEPTEEVFRNIPLSLSINLQGITYPDDHYIISQIEIIPSEIVFPPCLPGEVTNTNLMIRNTGPLALNYKIIPPNNSNIIMKPTMGIINQFVIIVAQLRSSRKGCRRFSEKWHVMLNYQESKVIPFILSGISTEPSVELGKHNCIKFEAVQPGTHTIQTVPLRNTSHFHASFNILAPEDVDMSLQPTEGDIAPHDTVFITFKHTASLCSPKKIVLKCAIQAMQKMMQSIGEVYEKEFVIQTEAIYSQLCAAPKSHDFELVQWGRKIGYKFHIFNFGITAINFHMDTSKRSHNMDIFKIIPENDSLNPGEQMEINFEGCTKTLGDNDISIIYMNRTSKSSQETTGLKSNELFVFSYQCALPELQIEEIVEHNFGPLFSKKDFWIFFNINSLNHLLHNIESKKIKTIDMHLPDFEIGSGPFSITLLVKNITIFDIDIDFSRKKVCDCKMKTVKNTFNTSKKIFDCPHREMLSVEINDKLFQRNSQRLLTINVKYTIPGDTKIAYILDIGDERSIELLFHIHTIPKDTGEISCFAGKFVASLENVSVERRVPPVQTFWLYNNTKMSVRYNMDTSEVNRICQREGFDIWQCMNPEGNIEPYRFWPLLFKFHPIEVRAHEVTIPIDFEYTKKTLRILGHGVPQTKPSNEKVYDLPQIGSTAYKLPITISANYLIFSALTMWNTAEQIILINNVTKDRIIQYEWAETGIRNIMNITASPKSGVLQPKESQTIVVKVKSFNEACIINKSLSCTLTDYNQIFLHRTSVALNDEKCKELEGHFMMTETGEQNDSVTNNLILHDVPKPDSIVLSININIIHENDIRLSQDNANNRIKWFTWSPREEIDTNLSNLMTKTLSSSKKFDVKYLKTETDDENRETYEHSEIFRMVLEELITNVTFSKTFRELLKTSVAKVPPYYHQIIMDDRLNQKTLNEPVNNNTLDKLRQEEIKKFFEKPKFSVVSEVFKDLILDSIQETFKLGITYPMDVDSKAMNKEVEALLKVCKDCSCKINKI